jgi:hypothetical protein
VRVVTQPVTESDDVHSMPTTPQLSLAVTPTRQVGSTVGLQPRSKLPLTQLSNVGGVVSTLHVNVREQVLVPQAFVAE